MASEAEQGGSSSIGTDFFDFTGKLSPCPLEGNGGGGPDGGGGELHENQVKKPGFLIGYYVSPFPIDYYSEPTTVETECWVPALDYYDTQSSIAYYPDSPSVEDLRLAFMMFDSGVDEILEKPLPGPCPRCKSSNTKFFFYYNYSLSQPRYFCKSCHRYWTHGGSLRNTTVGGGARKNATRSCKDYPLYETPLSVQFQGNSAQFWTHGGRTFMTNEFSKSCSEYQELAILGAKPQEDIADGRFHHKITNPSSPRNGYNSEDGGGQFHTIQVDEADHYSARSISNYTQALRSLINTSFASDQSDEPPTRDRSPSVIEIAAEIVQEEQEFNLSGLAKTFLSICAGEGFASLAVRYGTGNPLPENARILLSLGELCTVAAFLFCSGGYIMERSRRAKLAARLMTVGGVVAASSAFVLMMGSLLTKF